MDRERTQYKERTPWPGFVSAIFWGAIVLSCFPILAGWDHDMPPEVRWPLAGLIVAVAVGIKQLLGGLTVLVQGSRIVVHLGSVPVIRKTIAFADIVALRSIEYRPIRDFGGWGVRGRGRRRAWTARGNRAVELDLADDRQLLIGSDSPQRLEERIRAVAGDLLGGSGGAD